VQTGNSADIKVASHSDKLEADTACAIIASVAEALVSSAGLVQIVSRVNEDLRRGDDRVGLDLELRYFEALATLLEFNRFKLLDGKAQHDKASLTRVNLVANAAPWVPNLQYVMKSLDKMSFTRVLFTLERLNNKDKRFSDVVIPMKLYREMIGHLRVLLMSDDSAHCELALAALYRLFYAAASERQDPLLRLLSEWKPSVFSRDHLNELVELVTETLECLQAAKDKLRDHEAIVGDIKKKRSNPNKSLDIEQYIIAALRFSIDDYFRRIITVHTVDMFTRLLAKFATNTATINNHLFKLMWRMCTFQLEQDYDTMAPVLSSVQDQLITSNKNEALDSSATSKNTASSKPSLGYLLFNIQSLIIFSELLSAPNSQGLQGAGSADTHAESISMLQRLAKWVVRCLEEVTRKNHLVFVELLFTHTRAQEFCVMMDSVYEAPLFARSASFLPGRSDSTAGEIQADRRESDADAHQEPQRSLVDEYGDEFDENDAMFAKNAKPVKVKVAEKSASSKPTKPREKGWSADDDRFLREKYEVYSGTSAIFNHLATEFASR
jgi:hypothetical protein